MRRARVTRGALYHHFAGKRDLFRAAHESLEAELVARIGAALESAGTDDPVEAMRVATRRLPRRRRGPGWRGSR